MAIRVFTNGYLVLETAEDSLRSSQDFVGLLKQRICEVNHVPSHRQKLSLPGRCELTEGRTWRSLGSPLEVSMEIQPDDEVFAQGDDLLHACSAGQEKQVRLLLRKGQNPNLCRRGQPRPLDLAIDSGNLGTVKALLEGKAHLTTESLHLAVEKSNGHVEVLHVLLSCRPQLDILRRGNGTYAGMTPLQQACTNGYAEVAKVLLSARANVDVESATGETALHFVSTYETAVAVLQAGASPDARDRDEVKPYYRIMENGYGEAIKAFYEGDTEGNWKRAFEMSRVVAARHLSRLDRSLRRSVWVHEPIDQQIKEGARVNQDNHCGYTPLHMAAMCGNVPGAQVLLHHRANPNLLTRDADGATALHLAVKYCSVIWGDPEFVKVFLDGSADINKLTVKKESVLHAACESDNVEVVRSLIFSRAPLGVQDLKGATALHSALTNPELRNAAEIAQLLLIANAPLDVYAKDGTTAFQVAAKRGQISVLKSLMMGFARLDQPHRDSGDSPLHLAVKGKHLDVVKTLLGAMMAPSVQNNNGETSLHLAAADGQNEVASCLIAARAHINLENGKKQTAFMLALQKQHAEVLQTLREAGAHEFFGDPPDFSADAGLRPDPETVNNKNLPAYSRQPTPLPPAMMDLL